MAALFISLVLFAACSSSPTPSIGSLPTPAVSATEHTSSGAEIAFITSVEQLESPFGQGIWTSVSRFSGEYALPAASYKAETTDAGDVLSTLELAVTGGARIVISMDAEITRALTTAESQYPDIDFILLDGNRDISLAKNVAAVQFLSEQAGWLAGYLMVSEGYTTLGYAAMPDILSQRYGLGFLLGAEAAAAGMGLEPRSITMLPLLLDEELTTEEQNEKIAQLFSSGAQAVFAASAELQTQVIDAAKEAGACVVGFMLDTQKTGNPVLASIETNGESLIYQLLTFWKDDKLPCGKVTTGNVTDGGVVLQLVPSAVSTQAESNLKTAVRRFEEGRVATQMDQLLTPDAEGLLPAPQDLLLEYLYLVDPGALIETKTSSSVPLSASSTSGESSSGSSIANSR